MTIAHLTFGLAIGGIETMLVNIANEQVNLGHEVHIFVVNDIVDHVLTQRLHPRVVLHLIGRPRGSKNPIHYLRLNRRMAAVRPDIVHLHYTKLGAYIWVPALRRRMCATLHSMPAPDDTRFIRFCGPVFSISGMVADKLKSDHGVESTVVYNGVSFNEILQRDDRPLSHPLKIVQVGRLEHEIKGQDILLMAAAHMLEKGFTDFKITFIGDGSSRDYLQKMASELGLPDHTEFLGSKPQEYIFGHLRDYDLFLQPSRLDGFALTVAEAMAARVPVVVSDSQAPFEVIDFGRHGKAFHATDASDCARVIMDFAAAGFDPAAATEARRYALSNFDIAVTSARYLELYSHIAPRRRPSF